MTDLVSRILNVSPQETAVEDSMLAETVSAIFDCLQACKACADACLEEDLSGLSRCIRLLLDCADVCMATGQVLLRQTAFESPLGRSLVEMCSLASALCAGECSVHADRHEVGLRMDHCRECAAACRRCSDACDRLLAALPA